ncbi:MAG: 3-dehydroquinate synthase, partial [Clostridia bacterium]|nr:3-dehydroquinate synthase [Clostridia bacterium]
KVLIDPEVLSTLTARQMAEGFAEGLKMAATFDASFFEKLEKTDWKKNIEDFLVQSLSIKKKVVEQDEKEHGLRKLLNFGHTIGHGIESVSGGNLFHGECVALGMLPMCSDEVRSRLLPVLRAEGLPTVCPYSWDGLASAVSYDKKRHGNTFTVVTLNQIGCGITEEMTEDTLRERFITWQEGG